MIVIDQVLLHEALEQPALLEVLTDTRRVVVDLEDREGIAPVQSVRDHMGKTGETEVVFRTFRIELDLVESRLEETLLDT